jgi:hypothetical protein
MISADRAMYASKRAGRNRVAGAESVGEPSPGGSGTPVGVMAEESRTARPEVVEPPV